MCINCVQYEQSVRHVVGAAGGFVPFKKTRPDIIGEHNVHAPAVTYVLLIVYLHSHLGLLVTTDKPEYMTSTLMLP